MLLHKKNEISQIMKKQTRKKKITENKSVY